MAIAPEHFASRRDTIAFVVCILLSIGARMAPADVQGSMVAAIRNTVLAPFLAMQDRIEEEKTVHSSVAAKIALADSMQVQALEALALQQENESLRSLLGLSARVPVEHVAAEVLRVGQIGDFRTLTLSAGANKGIEPNDPVVALGGLVGHVLYAEAVTSTVLLWTDLNFRASAVTEARSPGGEVAHPVYGIVAPHAGEGRDNMLMELSGIPYLEEVLIGARVFTSGVGTELGGVYPRGIPLGTVVDRGEELKGWSRTYIMQPAVPVASVSHVIVLTGQLDDVSAAFEGMSR